jgi:hypothetical protein
VPFLNDLTTEFVASGVCSGWGEDLFTGTRAQIPVLSGRATLALIETGGTAADNTQNATGQPAFLQPSAQILARADTRSLAEAKAWDAYRVAFRIRNKSINGNWYRSVKALQSPQDLGVDDRGQIKYGFNVLAAYNRRD